MLQLLSTINGLVVVVENAGTVIGKITGWVVDPDRGKVVAYKLSNGLYVAAVDIRAFLSDGIIIGDENVAQPLDELIRIKAEAEKKVSLIGETVRNPDNAKIGSVTDVLIETPSGMIAKIYVTAGVLQRFFREDRVFPREHIVKITPKDVTVRYDDEVIAPGAEPEVAP